MDPHRWPTVECDASDVFVKPTTFAVVEGGPRGQVGVCCDRTHVDQNDVMYAAAGGGHLEFAQWARTQGCQDYD